MSNLHSALLLTCTANTPHCSPQCRQLWNGADQKPKLIYTGPREESLPTLIKKEKQKYRDLIHSQKTHKAYRLAYAVLG